MEHAVKSIRTFIGSKNFDTSRRFYKALGFEEIIVSKDMSYFKIDTFGFYLQDAYVKKWIENSMVFLEVDDTKRYWNFLNALKLTEIYKGVKLSRIHENDWGKECFLHDPSGVLWHFGEFYN